MGSTQPKTGEQGKETSSAEGPSNFWSDAREYVETLVFVLVLVCLLRAFAVEAFVIPTGSMATTLLGVHKRVVSPTTGYPSLINASGEVESGIPVTMGRGQNTEEPLDLTNLGRRGGDRVVVAKFLYEGFDDPDRWDVVVFKCPDTQKSHINFIKRLVGLPNETVKISYGDLWVRDDSDQGDGRFHIARKPPKVIDAVRRLVYDNDYPSRAMLETGTAPRWAPESTDQWTVADDGKSFSSSPKRDGWLDYRHLLPDSTSSDGPAPSLITDFESYNSNGRQSRPNNDWVGDLMIECSLEVRQLEGKVTFELVEAARVYQAVFDLATKKIELTQNGEKLAEASSPITSTGSWPIRFANFDDRLTLWVNGSLVFGDGVDVAPLEGDELGPTMADTTPVRIGSREADVTVSQLKIFRDLYYSQQAAEADYRAPFHSRSPEVTPDSVGYWREALSERVPREFSMADDEFLMFGDNSRASSDSREWFRGHVVPRHLLLGRALVLYWPAWRWRFVR
ncbi:signal peptidase I [Planctomycetes bacterium Pan216]|uniref:Signal peptidase I n=1 Tax=Kolteria novifilia TaxID=2527975 RepID=A0A518B282_9BACT|nr:signal peptidase I [Planctomycetes bacterium Pan216]